MVFSLEIDGNSIAACLRNAKALYELLRMRSILVAPRWRGAARGNRGFGATFSFRISENFRRSSQPGAECFSVVNRLAGWSRNG